MPLQTCCGNKQGGASKFHKSHLHRKKSYTFRPTEPSEAISQIQKLWLSDPQLKDVRPIPLPFVSSFKKAYTTQPLNSGHAGVRHVLLQPPDVDIANVDSTVVLCIASYLQPGATTHSFVNKRKLGELKLALATLDGTAGVEPDAKRARFTMFTNGHKF